jgi:hypothetical protein
MSAVNRRNRFLDRAMSSSAFWYSRVVIEEIFLKVKDDES